MDPTVVELEALSYYYSTLTYVMLPTLLGYLGTRFAFMGWLTTHATKFPSAEHVTIMRVLARFVCIFSMLMITVFLGALYSLTADWKDAVYTVIAGAIAILEILAALGIITSKAEVEPSSA